MPNRPPKGRGAPTHFTRVRGTKEPFHAHIAGPVYGCQCHWYPITRPCLKDFTDGELPCEGCENGLEEYWAGYQPLYRCMDGKPVVVILQDGMYDFAVSRALHARVAVGQGTDKYDGCWMTEAPGKVFTTTLEERKRKVDIEPWCINLWKRLPLLCDWFLAQQRHGEREKIERILSKVEESPPVKEEQPAQPPGMVPPMDKTWDAVTRRLKARIALGSEQATEDKPAHKNGKPR